jgi:hypothetical protein
MVQRHYRARETTRHIVSVRGKVIIPAGIPQVFGCLILDLSVEGAKIQLDDDHPLPDKIMLFESHRQNIYECVVRWRKERIAGVNFIDVCQNAVRRALLEECSLGRLDPVDEPQAGSVAAGPVTTPPPAA